MVPPALCKVWQQVLAGVLQDLPHDEQAPRDLQTHNAVLDAIITGICAKQTTHLPVAEDQHFDEGADKVCEHEDVKHRLRGGTAENATDEYNNIV